MTAAAVPDSALQLEQQTLPSDRLALSRQEKRDLVAFLKALDGIADVVRHRP